jgi:hypothetical protein
MTTDDARLFTIILSPGDARGYKDLIPTGLYFMEYKNLCNYIGDHTIWKHESGFGNIWCEINLPELNIGKLHVIQR